MLMLLEVTNLYQVFDKELVDLESYLITKDKCMIDDMKWLKCAMYGFWSTVSVFQ